MSFGYQEVQVTSNVSSTTAPFTPKADTMTLNSLGVNSLPLNGLLQPSLMQLGTAQGQSILMINDQTGAMLTQTPNVIIPTQTQTQQIIINGPGMALRYSEAGNSTDRRKEEENVAN